jgi:hypothetical protein
MKDYFKISFILFFGIFISSAPLLPSNPTTQLMLAAIARKKASAGFGISPQVPDADLDNTGVWTTAPLWDKLTGPIGSDDGDEVVSDTSPISTEPFTVSATTVADPLSSSNHILRARWAKATAAGANYDFHCELRQGYSSEAAQGTLIATVSLIAKTDTTLVTTSYTLSGAEADSITNYADLSFRCWAAKNGGGANRDCRIVDIEFATP